MISETFAELRISLYSKGYAQVVDEGDAHIAATSYCQNEQCEHYGLDYKGFKADGSYRAFAICPECGEVEEF